MNSKRPTNQPSKAAQGGVASAHKVGRVGEFWVAACFEDRGYTIIQQNVRLGPDEIDLVVQSKREILFIEVKTRTSRWSEPFRAFDLEKKKRQKRAARRWLDSRDVRRPAHYVVAAVRLIRGELPSIEYRVLPFWLRNRASFG